MQKNKENLKEELNSLIIEAIYSITPDISKIIIVIYNA